MFFYQGQVIFVKLILLMFHRRIFSSVAINRLLWATGVVIVLQGVAFMLATIFSCVPVDFWWNSWVSHEGKCIDEEALVWAQSTTSIIIDIWLLLNPCYCCGGYA